MLIYVATKNEGKFRELRDLFAPHGWRLATFDDYPDVEEGDVSYADNAARKARALRAGLLAGGIVAPVLGDDLVKGLGTDEGLIPKDNQRGIAVLIHSGEPLTQ